MKQMNSYKHVPLSLHFFDNEICWNLFIQDFPFIIFVFGEMTILFCFPMFRSQPIRNRVGFIPSEIIIKFLNIFIFVKSFLFSSFFFPYFCRWFQLNSFTIQCHLNWQFMLTMIPRTHFSPSSSAFVWEEDGVSRK